MSEEQATPQQQVAIHNVYLKDASFESPNSPAVFQQNAQPTIEVNLGINTAPMAEDTHEVTLSVTVTAKTEQHTAFLVEIQQAGIFTVRGFDDGDAGAVLGIYCPNALFPYAREAVSSLVSKGGFPPLLLEPVNFEALYAQHVQSQALQPQPESVQ
jgi:preprotein translocase subunit SecB